MRDGAGIPRLRTRLLARAFCAAGLALGFAVGASAAASGVECPRSMRIIVPSAPGGAGDTVARALADRLGRALAAPIIVENRPGASGMIGNDYVAKAPADGCTILFATSATQLIASSLLPNLPYDPVRDFAPVINAGYATSVVVTSAALPVATLAEFVAYARARPGRLNYASSGVGSANHIDSEVFMSLAEVRLVHVPYRGTADGYRALLANEVQMMIGAITSALPYIESSQVRPLVVLADRRSPLLPSVPTLAETGLGRADVRKWMGLLVPADTPQGVIALLNRSVDAILKDADMRAWMERQGMEVAGGTPDAFGRELRTDVDKWNDTVRRIGARGE